uniref:Uncharacterized protein n=1 Tax=Arundo donax TaxID=35708 RepID=A0A0A9H5Q6_ARUDO
MKTNIQLIKCGLTIFYIKKWFCYQPKESANMFNIHT